jgi:hypothetical protein
MGYFRQSYTMQTYLGGVFENEIKYSATWDPFGGNIFTIEEWLNGSWTNLFKSSTINDSHYNTTDIISEDWNNNQWEKTDHQKHTLTYNANNNLTERIIEMYFNNQFDKIERKVYSDFTYYTGIAYKPSAVISIFPNPATDYFKLTENTATESIEIFDFTGKQITPIFLNENTLDISTLSKGIYFINIRTKSGGSVMQKLVKQ